MFRYSTPSSAPSYSDAFVHNAAANFSAALPTLPTQIPRSAGGYLDGGNVNGFTTQFASAGVSSPPSYCSSLPSLSFYNIQRSISSHSLPLHHLQLNDSGSAFFSPPSTHQLPPLSSSPSSSSGDLFEFTSSCPVRRVFSTGDLQGMNGSPPPQPSGDSCGQDAGGPFSQKVGRYSAEERKERIERYRVKRHQRNFNKKITYACRKSLADSRPRVKGRFARNGEAEAEADEREPSENSYEYCGYSDPSNDSCNHGQYKLQDGGSCNDASHATALVVCADNGEWWWRIPGANTDEAERQRQAGFDVDEELWATLGDMMTVNLAS